MFTAEILESCETEDPKKKCILDFEFWAVNFYFKVKIKRLFFISNLILTATNVTLPGRRQQVHSTDLLVLVILENS